MEDPRDVIIRPVVSEKSYALSEKGVYIFVVPPEANKIEIRRPSSGFSMSRSPTSTPSTGPGKRKRNRKQATFGKRRTPSGRFVTLAPGQSIPLFETS